MESEQGRLISNSHEKIFQIFSEFMQRVVTQYQKLKNLIVVQRLERFCSHGGFERRFWIAIFEQLVTKGSELLAGFQQGVDYIRRPPVEKSSKLVDHIIKANETKRLLSYIDAGCVHAHDSVQNISKLNTCHPGLMDHLNKGKDIVDELELFLHNAAAELQAETDNFQNLQLKDIDQDHTASFLKESSPSCCQKPGATDYAFMMAVIYSMVKQDYNMQERIVSSLSLKSSSGELETYSLMWSLRPFIDDEIMHKAWKLIP